MYVGPPIDDHEILARLPAAYRDLLGRANGYVAFHGGLHVRGACQAPAWHSLRAVWEGAGALHRLFSAVRPTDVPFGEDALGDQFLLRDGLVHRLAAETGDMETLGVDLAGFDAAARADPVGYLGLEPLEAFRAEGGALAPGELLSVYPPFVVAADGPRRSYRAIPAADRLGSLARLAAQLRDLPDGTAVDLRVLPGAAV
jgi:hypothetical protein